MATVYAAVTSLMGTIQLISQSTSDLQEDHKEHLKLLYDKVGSMLEFLDTNSDDEPMKDLLKNVKDVAHKVEDEVESHIQREAQKKLLKMLQRVFHLPTNAHSRLLMILQRAIKDIDSVNRELLKLRENNMRAGNCSLGASTSSQSNASTLEKEIVGYNIEQELMLGQLRGHSSQLEVISIFGMGGIGTLSSKRTLDAWREVAKSVSSLVNLDDYERCSRVLSLSYSYLPSHLKACFLYFGVFPKASEISVKKLIRLWVAEGLLELKGLEELEKLGSSLLHDLINKSLVVVSKRSLDGKTKTCRIHDLLHDLCLREAEKENLLYVVNPPIAKGHRTVFPKGRRWVSLHSTRGFSSLFRFGDLTHSKTRSLHISFTISIDYLALRLNHFKLLRVLDLEKVGFDNLPREIVHLVSLRYLAMIVRTIPKDLPISKLWNLQTFVFPQCFPNTCHTIYLSNEIWEMSQLRHLHSSKIYLNSPPKVSSANEVKYRVLENLQSVYGLSSSCCTKEIFEGIKKVKKLGIFGKNDEYDGKSRCLDNLIYLHELEELSIKSYMSSFVRLPRLDSFPPNLKKLTLNDTGLMWKDMTTISMLPKLNVLQLKNGAFRLRIAWEVTEMGFPELKFLLLEELNLVYWRAADDYFPCLERVIIRNCRYLKEIPQGFADSVTLQQIELHGCIPSLVTFAERIQKEQLESLGSDMLKVYAFETIRGRAS
ncbi:putative late blight resistance protein homolog R1A-10 isoform X3 [Nicotiana tomentosiformis]|uniref:putative late blight resistance protein homolog R1A-10 isoform X3 n=1 Tax=Nicotiana tomentosiformis TaxID=4098 RepID=UPI00388C9590